MTRSRIRTHENVLRHVEDLLAAGSLRPGDRLPAERQLAEQLGVGRSSIREAIRVLEAMGLVRTAVGSGPAAGAVIVSAPAAGMSSALRFHVAAQSFPVGDVVQTRVLLESWAVREAARRGDRELLRSAGQLIDAMDDPSLSPVAFHRLDADFHLTLAQAAGNEVVAAVMAGLRESIEGYVLAAVPLLDQWSATARTLRRQHRAIHAAVAAGDADKAARLLARHIEGYYRQATAVRADS